jgi:uncharacterized membrane protein HdeD (DUF308 family)
MLETLARNWWILLIRGIAAIAFGLLAFVWPGLTLVVLVILFGAYVLADGVLAIYLALTGRTGGRHWGWILADGLLGIVAGGIALVWPGISALALLALIAAWAIIHGIFEIVAAIQLRRVLDDEWFMALNGVISILFGIALIAWPKAGILAVAWLIGVGAIAMGIMFVVLSLRLRSLSRATTRHAV